MSPTPRVSVIIPTYNGAAHIRETVDSVLAQTMPDFELIVVDDGSMDNTAELLSGVDSRLRVYRQENQGIAGARNTGVARASADFIAFLDHDDVWHPDKLQAQLAVLDQHGECGVCYGTFKRWNGDVATEHLGHGLNPEDLDPRFSGKIYHALVETNHVLLGTAMFRRQLMEEVGEFNAALPPADDWDYAVRASQLTDFAKLRDVVTLYRIHHGMTSKGASRKDHETDFRESIVKKYGLSSSDGRSIPEAQYRARNYRSCIAHGHANYKARKYDIASQSFRRAICFRRWAPEAHRLLWLSALRGQWQRLRAQRPESA